MIAILIALGVGIGSAAGVVWLAGGGIGAHGATGATRHAWCPLDVSSGVMTPHPGPTGNSSPNGTSYYANGTVVFYGSASGCTAPYTFTYVFGDGTSSSGPADVVHVYPGAGYYAGSLNVSDSSGEWQVSYFCVNASNWPNLGVGSGNPATPCP